MVTDFVFGIIKPLTLWFFLVSILNMAIVPMVFVDNGVTEVTAIAAGILVVLNLVLMLPFFIVVWRGKHRRFPRSA